MIRLQQIKNRARQRLSVSLPENVIFELVLKYQPTQQAWVMDIIYENFAVYNLALNVNVNCLYPFRNILPFGIMCVTNNSLDPFRVDDFSEGRAKLYVLTESDKTKIESQLFTNV